MVRKPLMAGLTAFAKVAAHGKCTGFTFMFCERAHTLSFLACGFLERS